MYPTNTLMSRASSQKKSPFLLLNQKMSKAAVFVPIPSVNNLIIDGFQH